MQWILLLLVVVVSSQSVQPAGGPEPQPALYRPTSFEPAYKACREIIAATGDQVEFPGTAKYNKENKRYWSQASADLKPACIVFPSRTENVAKVVQVLQQNPEVRYAVKSGGHMPNAEFNSVHGGVLIAFSSMAQTYYDPTNKLALVEPGARWGSVIKGLEPWGVSVVGGRLADVGVAGLLLGGGLSFLSTQRGLASVGVKEYEVVLANATVARVNNISHPDLYYALKAGGNQFGIVTKFTMETFPMGKVWGGYKLLKGRYAPQVIAAVNRLTESYPDPKAAVIATFDRLVDKEVIVLFFFYDGPKPPPGVFAGLDQLPSTFRNVRTRSYSDLLATTNRGNVIGVRYIIRTATLPNLPTPRGADLLTDFHSMWQKRIDQATRIDRTAVGSMALQPLPISIARETNKRGGTPMGMREEAGDHLFIEMDISWKNGIVANGIHDTAANITEDLNAMYQAKYSQMQPSRVAAVSQPPAPQRRYGLEGNKQQANETGSMYFPIFPNDATWDQGVYRSWKDYAQLGETQRKYDPEGFFSKRTVGWRL